MDITDTKDTPTAIKPTPVQLGKPRGGPAQSTLRKDYWWVTPTITVGVLTAFVIYATWAGFQNGNYYYAPYISPFYSPCIASNCVYQQLPIIGTWWKLSPALLILVFPLGYRLTCYYYRKAYYRAFWWAPPACAVEDAHSKYSGETRWPLLLQNSHRWFFYMGLVLNFFLTIDAVRAFDFPSGWGMGLGSLVLSVNAILLWLYSFSCHACRHLCGGSVNKFSTAPLLYRVCKIPTPLTQRHTLFACVSLIFVALSDLYVRLVASGAIRDPRFF